MNNDTIAKWIGIALLIFLVINGYVNIRIGYNRKPKFLQWLENASCFVFPTALICYGTIELLAGNLNLIGFLFLAGFGGLLAFLLISFGRHDKGPK